ncbi:MAG: AMP-binding protein, partial [Acidobacteriota bacterium]
MDRLALYRRLPYPLKVLTASLRGWHLDRWRYGADLEHRVAEIHEREHWDSEAWERWRDTRLADLLRRAIDAPAYARAWADRPGDPTRLADWPVLQKPALRADPTGYLVSGTDPRKLYPEHTSGSTGTPLRLWWGRDTVRGWYALVEARLRRWHGIDRRDRWAILGGQLVTDVRRTRPPFWVWNAGMRQLYLSAYHLSPSNARAQLDALHRHRVRYLLGYPSALHALASALLDQQLDGAGLGLRVVITNAEPLYPHQRLAIGKAFDCPVRETYGMAELVAGASECDAGRLHLWPEVGAIEIGDRSELIATGLLNHHQPLIRYRVGDRLVLADESTRCSCGRT